jgi:hypothetical protein
MTKRAAKSKVRARFKQRKLKESQIVRGPRPTPSLRRAFVELSEDYKWIEVWFPYAHSIKDEIQEIPSAHFKGKDQGGPKWRVPRDLITANKLREIFGPTTFWNDPETDERVHITGLWIGDALRSWARQQQQLERNLGELTSAKDAKLHGIPEKSRIARAIAGDPIPELSLPPLPTGRPHPLMVARPERSYQRADIRIMSMANVMNLNQPGTGKTIETIGSWVESGALQDGPILVVGPVRSLENTWLEEILLWLGDFEDISVYTDENPIYRKQQIENFLDAYEAGELDGHPSILCVNYEWIRLVMTHRKGKPMMPAIERVIGMKLHEPPENNEDPKHVKKSQFKFQENLNYAFEQLGIERDPHWDLDDCLWELVKPFHARKDHKGNYYAYSSPLQRRLMEVLWSAAAIDEFHKSGMNNRMSLFYQGVGLLKVDLKAALSGTPMGGKPRKLWPIFHWLDPEEFPAEGHWIDRWLETEAGRTVHSKIVRGIKKGMEEEFGKHHARWMIRRVKLTSLPGLPPRVEQVIWCKMSPSQEKQYRDFSKLLEIKIDDERLSANNILTEYMRLKQFANAKQRMVQGVPYPTEDSGKLEDVLRILDENGVRPLKDDPEPGARAIIGSESSRMVYMISAWLTKNGIENSTFTGETKDSDEIIHRFKRGGEKPYVIVMTIQTGGVSLNLEEAQSMLQVDETWNPDDTEQFFERGDRGTRTEPLRCYIFRTRATIQEYIADVNEGKSVTNATVLDIRRRIHEAEDLG